MKLHDPCQPGKSRYRQCHQHGFLMDMELSALMMLPHVLQLLLLDQIATVKIPRFAFLTS